MALNTSFEDIALDALHDKAIELRDEGWRAVQILCTSTDQGVDITYSFHKDDDVRNYQLRGVAPDTAVPSIQDAFIGMFPFENEAKDLFGVNIDGMVLDFAGEFYQTRMDEPMTVLTPEAKARKDKEAKKAAAAAAKAAKAKDAAKAAPAEKAAPAPSSKPAGKTEWWPADMADQLKVDPEAAQAAAEGGEAVAQEAAPAQDAGSSDGASEGKSEWWPAQKEAE